ncbi:MAG: L,D-transpeptidase [bacterium]|nr:L,D-transpeptidase [bacterium]
MELRRPSRRLVIAAVAAITVATAAVAWTWPWLQGRHHPPLAARSEAERALNTAVTGDGVLPAEIALVRLQMERSITEDRRQGAAFPWRRDFRAAASSYRLTAANAASVLAAAGRRVAEARQAAEVAVASSSALVGDTDRLASGIKFPQHERARLKRAVALAEEARIALKEGDFESAVKAATRATQEAQAARLGGVRVVERFANREQVAIWRRWQDETIAATRGGGSAVIVNKERKEVALYRNGVRARTYQADFGKNSLVDKRVAGDGATPEGRYRVTSKRGRGQTTYYKALMLDYPNAEDRRKFAQDKKAGRIARNARIGHLIEIHGDGGRDENWTQGCVALANPDMDDLFNRVSVGTPVTIIGGDGTGDYSVLWRAHAASQQGAR